MMTQPCSKDIRLLSETRFLILIPSDRTGKEVRDHPQPIAQFGHISLMTSAGGEILQGFDVLRSSRPSSP